MKKKTLTKEQKENIKTALELLCEETTTLTKIKKLSTILQNTNPKIEKQLKSLNEVIKKIQQVQEGEVIVLSMEKLPEKTNDQKKRKKLVLLLLASWKDLHSEVSRLNDLYNTASTAGVLSKESAVKGGKILATAKGPLGIITFVAAGIVAIGALLNSKSVNITIQNLGCPQIPVLSSVPINLPGLKLPRFPIENGGTGVVNMIGVDIDVEISKSGYLSLGAMGASYEFNLPYRYTDIVFDGKSLIGQKTTLKLSESKSHELLLICK